MELPQPRILEQAIVDCLDCFNMGGISQALRFKLIKEILVSTWRQEQQFQNENRMFKAQRLAPRPKAKYLNGQSQTFYACYHLSLKGGAPSRLLQGIKNIIADNEYFLNHSPEADYFIKSRRAKKAPVGKVSLEGTILQDLTASLNEADLPGPIEPVEPKVTIVTEGPQAQGPPLLIDLGPKRS